MPILQPGLQYIPHASEACNRCPTYCVQDAILGFDFITKCHYETASRLDSVVICYGWLLGLVI